MELKSQAQLASQKFETTLIERDSQLRDVQQTVEQFRLEVSTHDAAIKAKDTHAKDLQHQITKLGTQIKDREKQVSELRL